MRSTTQNLSRTGERATFLSEQPVAAHSGELDAQHSGRFAYYTENQWIVRHSAVRVGAIGVPDGPIAEGHSQSRERRPPWQARSPLC
jgi:hypothetical protein